MTPAGRPGRAGPSGGSGRKTRPTPAKKTYRVTVTRAYDAPGGGRGYRVLVDRLWPRGVTKADAAIDEWSKDVAPSAALRTWYGHEPARFAEFATRYRKELQTEPGKDALSHLRSILRTRPLVLVTATRDVEHSGAMVLQRVLSRRR